MSTYNLSSKTHSTTAIIKVVQPPAKISTIRFLHPLKMLTEKDSQRRKSQRQKLWRQVLQERKSKRRAVAAQSPSRVQPSTTTATTAIVRPDPGFPFFRLPPELRRAILECVCWGFHRRVHDWHSRSGSFYFYPPASVLPLLLVSKQLFREIASLVYDTIRLETWGTFWRWGPDTLFLMRSVYGADFVQRLHVRFWLKQGLELSKMADLLLPAVHDMLEYGSLKHLELVIGTKDAHGSAALDPFRMAWVRVGDQERHLPEFLTQSPFQRILRLLQDPRLKSVKAWIEAPAHLDVWCPFHEQDRPWSSAANCYLYHGYRRSPFGRDRLLALDWKKVVESYLGAERAKKYERPKKQRANGCCANASGPRRRSARQATTRSSA
jgi:hypothetical protein